MTGPLRSLLARARGALERAVLGVSADEIRYTFSDVRNEIRATRAELLGEIAKLREELLAQRETGGADVDPPAVRASTTGPADPTLSTNGRS